MELKRARNACSTGEAVSDVVVANRRLRYFETVLNAEGNAYMTEAEMRRRDPAGWDYFVAQGRNVPLPANEDDDMDYGQGLGAFFIRALQRQQLRVMEAAQKGTDQAMESLMTGESMPKLSKADDPMDEGSEEDENLMDLWKRSHKAKFIRGEDEFFDYTQVDENDEYDDMKQIAADEEERWFEEDED